MSSLPKTVQIELYYGGELWDAAITFMAYACYAPSRERHVSAHVNTKAYAKALFAGLTALAPLNASYPQEKFRITEIYTRKGKPYALASRYILANFMGHQEGMRALNLSERFLFGYPLHRPDIKARPSAPAQLAAFANAFYNSYRRATGNYLLPDITPSAAAYFIKRLDPHLPIGPTALVTAIYRSLPSRAEIEQAAIKHLGAYLISLETFQGSDGSTIMIAETVRAPLSFACHEGKEPDWDAIPYPSQTTEAASGPSDAFECAVRHGRSIISLVSEYNYHANISDLAHNSDTP